MTPHIILIMQENYLIPIDFMDDLCVCKDDGSVMVFGSLESADSYREQHSIDGKIVELPTY